MDQSKEEVIEIAIELHNNEMEDRQVNEEFIDQAYDLGFLYEQDSSEVRGMQMFQNNGIDK